jgi:bifunctional UDP-N-acetylglucosamine pyrophosphorylase/glucosamine-1-phosphate N-acetyltransferase
LLDAAAVILAAGKSKRMKSALPKAAHPICGKPMTRHVVDACFGAGIEQLVVVIGHGSEAVKRAVGSDVQYVLQEDQLGTGHAAMRAMPLIDRPYVLILPADTPLITSAALSMLMESHLDAGAAATLLTADLSDPGDYGRVVRGPDGSVERIIEARDAPAAVLAIGEIATSIYCFDSSLLRESLAELGTDNAQGEYYLTDTVETLRRKGHTVRAMSAPDARDTLGINTGIELAEAAAIMRRRVLDALMLDGVTVVDPNTTYIDARVRIGRDSVIHPCTVIEGRTVVGTGCMVGPFAVLTDASLGDNVEVVFSAVARATLAVGARVGPFEHIEGREVRNG